MTGGPLGLLLAAGAGRRMGTPKALVATEDGGTWVARAARVLADGGCADVLVVLGAQAAEAVAALPADVEAVWAERWRDGMGASLAAGLRAAAEHASRPAVRGGPPRRPARRARRGGAAGARPRAAGAPTPWSARRTTAGPVTPWSSAATTGTRWRPRRAGSEGANRYLAEHDALAVECGDLADGRDVDTPEALRRPAAGH